MSINYSAIKCWRQQDRPMGTRAGSVQRDSNLERQRHSYG
jgi:hypothetical protein